MLSAETLRRPTRDASGRRKYLRFGSGTESMSRRKFDEYAFV
jgi:hypothetical protein